MINEGWNILHFIQEKSVFYCFCILIIVINVLIIGLLGFSTYYLINIGNGYVEEDKKIITHKKNLFYLFILFIIFLLFILLYNCRDSLFELCSPLIWSIIFAYLLNPVVRCINKRGISRIWSVIIVYVIMILGIFMISITITPRIIEESRKLVEVLPQYTKEANELFNRFYMKIEKLDRLGLGLSGVQDSITENLERIQYYILKRIKHVTGSILNMFSQIIKFVLIPIFTFYFLKDADYFKKSITYMIPKKIRRETIYIGKDIHKLLNKFIRGQVIVAICVGALSIGALWTIGVSFTLLLGIVAGISNIIPYFGPIIGAIPAVVVALLDEPTKAWWVMIAFIIIQQIESAVITPKIVGESVGLHPVIVVVSLLIGHEYFGIIGLIFSVPVVASIKIICRHMMDLIVKA